ncbi:isochorismatase family protein YecD [mine drainage metagenome]|uniref:Isochorismatase family protein YecD n=1 Tax=mine drainage metagenome TaxID=410659 RepID=A0A1J5R4R3_9ZZZZ
MALTTLDPTTALLVIDLQNGVLALPAVHPVDEVVSRAGELADAFRAHGLPVVLVTVDGAPSGRTERRRPGAQQRPTGWAELVPGLNRQPGDHTVTKRTWGAFTNTDLAEYLRSQEVTQVVIAGIATSIGVESTARHAHEHGFNVTLAVDAMTDSDPDAHANSIARIFPRLGETGTTREIVELLSRTRS